MNSPPPTESLAPDLLDAMFRIKNEMDRHARKIHPENTTLMQVRVLLFLTHHAQTVSGLAKVRGVSLQAASTLVQGLVERGWVVRTPDPDDRRQSRLEVTPEGLACAQMARDQMLSHFANLLTELGPDEVAAGRVFLQAMKRILKHHALAGDPFDSPTDHLPDE